MNNNMVSNKKASQLKKDLRKIELNTRITEIARQELNLIRLSQRLSRQRARLEEKLRLLRDEG
jgi:hypothetical protein